MIELIILLFVTITCFLIIKKPHNYWRNKGIPFMKPTFLIGNLTQNILRKKALSQIIQDGYNIHPNKRYFGIYQFTTPTLVVRDPKLIKKITVEDFDHFPDHRVFTDEEIDPLWSKNLFASREKKWRHMRPTISPIFTSSKMKFMFSLIEEISEQFVDYFMKKDEDLLEVEFKDAFTRYTNDVIGTTAFGVKCNSLKEQENEFYLMGTDASDFTGIKNMKFLVANISPYLIKVFGIKVFSKKVRTFFRNLIKETIALRTEKGIVRPDLIHLLLEARKGRLKYEEDASPEAGFAAVEESNVGKIQRNDKPEITDEDITAQALIFFLGGFDTSSNLMAFIAYELALNPDVQDKLRLEVNNVFNDCNGKLTYEALMGMKYLDMVISETLRKWPPFTITDRECTRPYTILAEKPDENPLLIERGTLIWIPIHAIHNDPEYFPNPEKFDPERFSNENKQNIKPYTFLPFGSGPRNCIGSRFAIMENKAIFFHILRNFELVVIKKTPVFMVLDPKYFNLRPKGGFWVGLKKIKSKLE